jgi:oligopeptidase B
VWAEDNQTLFYVRQDPQTLRAYQVYRHKLGTDPAQDTLVYQEDDPEFSVGLEKTRSRKYIVIGSRQTLSNEYRLIDAFHPEQPLKLFATRQPNHEYQIDHINDTFYIVSNHQARNFRCLKASAPGLPVDQWQEVIPHRPEVLLESVVLFDRWLLAVERFDASTRLRVLDLAGNEDHSIAFDETAFAVFPAPVERTDTPWLRLVYMSLSTPPTTYDYHMERRERVLVKQQEVLGGFDPTEYQSERLWATARDGARVPVSLVRRRDTPVDGTAPLLLYGYGSYGASMSPFFNGNIISLLDRGWIYAIAHVRGGQEMGRNWYERGKLLQKMNTFTDFIDVAKHLREEKYADPERIYAEGGSAGGLLMGAVMNLEPDLFDGIVAGVPFVDVVTTMLDDSIPLTTSEYDEWGDPNDPEYFHYMLSYSPYDNVRETAYPHLLVTTGLHDSQVQYWEPAKWVAKLRAMRTNGNLLLMKTNMSAGHGGASGRYDRHKETALRYAFLLHVSAL